MPIGSALVYGRAIMSSLRNSFCLLGHSSLLDHRIHAVRDDLADVSLADRIFAPHYAAPVRRTCLREYAAVRDAPDGQQVTELLQGEQFMVLDVSAGWAWGYCAHDHYVGYIEASTLGDEGSPPVETPATDLIAAAERFLGRPYVFGGRGGSGIDCSGLIQRAAAAIGVAAERDSDMQQASLGELVEEGLPLGRGDLVFFPDHVVLMRDAETAIHATRFTNMVCIEPLADIAARIASKLPNSVPVAKRLNQ